MATSMKEASALGGLFRLGKHFQRISIIPATVVALGLGLLLASGAPGAEPNLDRAVVGVRAMDFQDGLVVAVVVIVLGAVMHPFQFSTTQFLEGYWGSSPIGISLMYSRARLHFERRRRSGGRAESAELAATLAATGAIKAGQEAVASWEVFAKESQAAEQSPCSRKAAAEAQRIAVRKNKQAAEFERTALRGAIQSQQYGGIVARYPLAQYRIMPTILGNVLRKYEDLAGRPYGLDSVVVTPHLISVADEGDVEYLNDARGELGG